MGNVPFSCGKYVLLLVRKLRLMILVVVVDLVKFSAYDMLVLCAICDKVL